MARMSLILGIVTMVIGVLGGFRWLLFEWRSWRRRKLYRWAILSLLVSAPAWGADHFVVPSGGGGAGTSWTNACNGFAGACAVGSLVRGDRYYIADSDGTPYTTFQFTTAESGLSRITIQKATIADHGGAIAGWLDSMGDGQANFSNGLEMYTCCWSWLGVVRNESDWNNGASYGIHFDYVAGTNAFCGGGLCSTANHIVLDHVDVGHSDTTVCVFLPATHCDAPIGVNDYAFYIGSGDDPAAFTDWTVTNFRAHNIGLAMQLFGIDNITIQRGWIGPNWSKEAIRGGNASTSNANISYNKFVDSCLGLPGFSGAEGCTATIAIFRNTGGTSSIDGNKVHSNLIFERANYPGYPSTGANHTDGVIKIVGNNGIWPGPPTNSSAIYNNTIVGIQDGPSDIGFADTGTGNQAFNNIWYQSAGTGCDSATPSVCNNNAVIASGAQFVNPLLTYPATGFDFHLASATAAGTTLSAPYNVDMDGTTRGVDGNWDLGAYEFNANAGAPSPPSPFALGRRLQLLSDAIHWIGLSVGIGSLLLNQSVRRGIALGARLSARVVVLGAAYVRYQTIDLAQLYLDRTKRLN